MPYLRNEQGEVIGHILAPEVRDRVELQPVCKLWPQERGKTMITDCCVCRLPTRDLNVSGFFQDWYGWTFKVECKEGRGCSANPRKKCGADLRHWSVYGD